MYKYRNSLIGFAGLSFLIGAIALVTPRPTQGQDGDTVGPPKPVKVINTPAEPVPVTGTTTITGDISLAPGTSVAINNTPNVNVVNTPTVQVGNTPDAPVSARDVDNPARQPFHKSINIGFPSAFVVPNGKRLVIEFFSARVSFPAECRLSDLSITTTTEGEGALHFFLPTTIDPVLLARAMVVSQETRIYADPGTEVKFGGDTACFLGGTLDQFIATGTISGYLVDWP
jgi:hypothetical protein